MLDIGIYICTTIEYAVEYLYLSSSYKTTSSSCRVVLQRAGRRQRGNKSICFFFFTYVGNQISARRCLEEAQIMENFPSAPNKTKEEVVVYVNVVSFRERQIPISAIVEKKCGGN